MTTPRIAPTDRLRPNRGIVQGLAMMVGTGLAGAAIVVGTVLLPTAPAAYGQAPPNVEDYYLAVVTGNDVHVRSGGADSYYPFGKVHKGDVVMVIGEKHNWARVLTTGPAFRDFFAYIRYTKSDEGRFQLDESGHKGRTLGLTRALAPNLNTNYEPDDSWKRILLIEAETELEVLETIESERAVVHKIVMPQKAEGWISTAFLKPASSREIAAWETAIERSKLIASGALPGRKVAEPAPPRPLAAAGPEYPGTSDPDPSDAAGTTNVDSGAIQETTLDATMLAHGESSLPTVPAPLEATVPAARDTPIEEFELVVIERDAWPIEATTTVTPTTTPDEETATNVMTVERPLDQDPAPMQGSMVEWPVRTPAPIRTDAPTYDQPTPVEHAPLPRPEPDFGETQPVVHFDSPAVTAVTSEDVMPRPAAPPSPFDRIAAAIRNKAPKAALADLEGAYQRLRSEPIETAEVLPLRHLYRSLASTTTDDREVVRYAEARAEQLSIWADLQQRRGELEQLRARLKVTVEEAEATRLSLEQSGSYQAVGRLVVSTVYDGVRLPRLYRVQDADSGRTIVYLKPDNSFDLPAMIGQVIGVIGRPMFEEKLRLNLIEPKRIDLLASAG